MNDNTIRFTAVETFHSEETGSEYVAGLSYTATSKDFRLIDLLNRWFADGKIMFGGNGAVVSGRE